MAARSRHSGFTLIELLVTIAIIAILTTISVVVYTNAQSTARDAQRRSEIDAVSQALETNYDAALGQYSSLLDIDFANATIPQDPRDGQTSCQGLTCKYCLRSSKGNCGDSDPKIDVSNPADGVGSYVLCTNLETGSPSFYCKSSQR